MTLIWQLILITSIWCLGIKIVTQEGMALERLGKFGTKKVQDGYKIYDPIIHCEWCLPSIHSLIGYAFAVGIGLINVFEWKLVIIYPLVVCGSSILSGTAWTLIQLIISLNEYFKK